MKTFNIRVGEAIEVLLDRARWLGGSLTGN